VPHGFELAEATGLGLSIVRTLVTSELVGQIALARGSGTYPRPGTVVELQVPVAERE
jgi:two-component sensor histidine kinase